MGLEIEERKSKLPIIAVCGVAAIVIVAGSALYLSPSEEPTAAEPEQVVQTVRAPSPKESVDTSAVEGLFPGASISVQMASGHTGLIISTDLPATQPDEWEDVKASLVDAVGQVYASKAVVAELRAADGTILTTVSAEKVMYDAFRKVEEQAKKNSPFITKHEFDSIAIGMSYSEVCDIVGSSGALDFEIGDGSKYSSIIQTYTWAGEYPDSYASINFENFRVYAKHSFLLD